MLTGTSKDWERHGKGVRNFMHLAKAVEAAKYQNRHGGKFLETGVCDAVTGRIVWTEDEPARQFAGPMVKEAV